MVHLAGLTIQPQHDEQMLAHILSSPINEEVCGFIAITDNISQAVFPITNTTHSPTRFLMDAEEQLKAFLTIKKQGWELGAIYHTHLNGCDHPSETDIAEAAYPEAIYLIWYKENDVWQCKGYTMMDT